MAITEESLDEKVINSRKSSKWKIYLFPFPKLALLLVITGLIILSFFGLPFTIVTIYCIFRGLWIVSLFFGLLAFCCFYMGGYIFKFGIEIWRDSRPYWAFHPQKTQTIYRIK